CLQTIKDSANASGIRCFITTTQPRDNFSESERQKLKELRDLIIQRFGPYAIDFWTDVTVPVNLMNPLYNLGDKIHLTPTAHTLLKNRAVNANIFFIALPVNFQQFNAQKKTASVALQWSTSSEINSHHFDIEKSMDGVKFTHLATVAASGNSSQLLNYTAEDAHPFTGSNYYRIVSVDNNQQKTFSNKLSVSFNKTGFSASEVYNNPVANMLSFQLESDKKEMVEIIVFSTDGRKVSEENVLLNKTMLFKKDVSKLPSGRYTIRIETATEKITRPFIKQ
ncbi:MAG: T9SS type A sorting domain-containing protein, partial [Chitinophagaceae bacterium]